MTLRVRRVKNRNYNRERKHMSDQLKKDVRNDQLLQSIHKEHTERIQGQIDTFYTRYASKEGLTRSEARKKADAMDVRDYFEKARVAVEEKDFSDEANEWLRTYNLKMKTSRLEVLKAEINLEMLTMYNEDEKLMDRVMTEQTREEIARQERLIREYKEQAGVLSNSTVSPIKDIQGIVNADFYGASFSERIWGRNGYYDSLQKDLFGSLNNIYVDMQGYQKERNKLMDKYQASEYEAMRLLKTETSRINADVQLAMLKENEFTHMIYATEMNPCDICADLEGTAVLINEVEPGVNMFPMHPNCVCSAYGHIEMEYTAGGSTLDGVEIYDDGIVN